MSEIETGVKFVSRLNTPVSFLFLSLIISQICNVFYYANGLEPSGTFQLLSGLSFFLIITHWLKQDFKKQKIPWLIDMGFFVYLFWFFIIPIHLFTTRGVRAFLTILVFLGMYILAYLISFVVYQMMILL